MMNCREIEEHLADYLGGETSDEQARRIEAHLGTCAKCRAEVASLQAACRSMAQLPPVRPDLAARSVRGLRIVRSSGWPRRLAWSLTKAAALLAIGIGLGRYGWSNLDSVSSPGIVEAPGPTSGNQTGGSERAFASAAKEVHPDWIELGRNLRTADSSFARDLAVIARAGHPRNARTQQ